MNLFMYGRMTGKSVFNSMVAQLSQPSVIVLDQTQVDQDQWYTVDVEPAVASWIRQQPKQHWYEHSGRTFRSIIELHEHLYTMMILKWS
jgi:hypothetical protein